MELVMRDQMHLAATLWSTETTTASARIQRMNAHSHNEAVAAYLDYGLMSMRWHAAATQLQNLQEGPATAGTNT